MRATVEIEAGKVLGLSYSKLTSGPSAGPAQGHTDWRNSQETGITQGRGEGLTYSKGHRDREVVIVCGTRIQLWYSTLGQSLAHADR